MNKYPVYIILGVCAIIYIVVQIGNRRSSNRRKSRKFMDGKRKKD